MDEHPEGRPEVQPLDHFTFSLDAGRHAEEDLDLQITALKNRIGNIVQRVEINGMPILQSILGLTHDEKELETLGKALLRVAPLMPQLDEKESRKRLIELAIKEPQWVAATFADFSKDVEDITKHENEDN